MLKPVDSTFILTLTVHHGSFFNLWCTGCSYFMANLGGIRRPAKLYSISACPMYSKNFFHT